MNSIQELIDFAESIPDNEWIEEKFCENVNDKRSKQKGCFIGHLNFHLTGNYLQDIFLGGLLSRSKVLSLLKLLSLDEVELQHCNNGTHEMNRYGETPKSRIKSFLQSKLVQ